MSTLEDAVILNGTIGQAKGDILIATYVLPDGTEFHGEFESAEQMKKLAMSWCETVREHWKAKTERKLNPIPEVEESALSEIIPVSTGSSAQQMIIDQYNATRINLAGMQEERDTLDVLIEEAESLCEELKPLVDKWGAP